MTNNLTKDKENIEQAVEKNNQQTTKAQNDSTIITTEHSKKEDHLSDSDRKVVYSTQNLD